MTGLTRAPKKNLNKACPACGSANWDTLMEVDKAPISCAQLFPSREAAERSASCRLEITLCRDCAHIWNAAYQPSPISLYGEDYYSSVTVSGQAREHQVSLAQELDRLIGFNGKKVLEIGCGDGFFLQSIKSLKADVIGFEPSATFTLSAEFPGVQVFNEHFDFTQPLDLHGDPDMVVMRHVLEHLPAPRQQLSSLSNTCFPNSPPEHIFLEVPNARQILKDSLFFDFYHDHIQYFSLGSLHHMLTETGWWPVSELGSNGEFLQVISVNSGAANTASGAGQPLLLNKQQILSANQAVFSDAERFQQNHILWKTGLTESLTDLRERGMKIAAWGAGARGVALLSGLGLPEGMIEYVVDSDPNKHGRFLPSLHVPVFPTEHIRQQPVDCILVTSYTFFDEILDSLDWFRAKGGQVLKIYPALALV